MTVDVPQVAGLPLEEGEMPETVVTVEMSPVLDQSSESPVKE
jgi:hypothetical protein